MGNDIGGLPEETPDANRNAASSPASAAQDVGRFATTHWSLVLIAGQRGTPDANAALEKLCQMYWLPLYGYVRRRGTGLHDAHDLTQAFFARVLEKNYLGDADPARGRFRTFLLTAFQHFLSKEWEMNRAQRRGGGKSPLSLDFDFGDSLFAVEPTGGLTPEQIYERQWAITLLNRVLERLEREMGQAGKRLQFERLKEFIIGSTGEATYTETAKDLGMTASAARMAASRMRQRYRELLREEISQTLSSPEDVDDEIRQLFKTVRA